MIRHICEQGTVEWLRLRMGLPTASDFHKIVTPTGKISKQAEGYMYSLLAEIVVGHPIVGPETDWMSRGTDMEQEAVDAYEFHTGRDAEVVGFVTNDDVSIGASPDRLVGEDGTLEIKCPAPKTHLGYMLTSQIETDYYPQIQGQLWITGRKWVDIVSYHPEMPPVVIRVERDRDYIDKLDAAVSEFVRLLRLKRAELEKKYGEFKVKLPEPVTDGLAEYGFLTAEDAEAIIADRFPAAARAN